MICVSDKVGLRNLTFGDGDQKERGLTKRECIKVIISMCIMKNSLDLKCPKALSLDVYDTELHLIA